MAQFVLGCVMCIVYIQTITMLIVQCFVNDLNDVTENDQIKHELRKWGPF